MASMKVIKRRLASVATTKKVMKAMNLVAATKLQKDKAQLAAAEIYLTEAARVLNIVRNYQGATDSFFFAQRSIRKTGYLIITSNRGFCGSYNNNLIDLALTHMSKGRNEVIITVGQKGYEFFSRQEKNIIHSFNNVLDTHFYDDAILLTAHLIKLFHEETVDEVYVVFTKFLSALTHEPTIERILPLERVAELEPDAELPEFDPDFSVYLRQAVPLYISSFIYQIFLHSSACEQAARMISMDTAVNNAQDIIARLTRLYNRNRQAAITAEIGEMVSSTNVLNERSDTF